MFIKNFKEQRSFFSNFELSDGGYFTVALEEKVFLIFVRNNKNKITCNKIDFSSCDASNPKFLSFLKEKNKDINEFFVKDNVAYLLILSSEEVSLPSEFEIEFVSYDDKDAAEYTLEYFFLGKKRYDARNVFSKKI